MQARRTISYLLIAEQSGVLDQDDAGMKLSRASELHEVADVCRDEDAIFSERFL